MEGFDIRYTKLNFTIKLIKDSILPISKSSAIRGGMGSILLEMYCIYENYECKKCDFNNNCCANNILNTRLDMEVNFLNDNVGSSYIIECSDSRTNFKKDDLLEFSIILWGKNIINIPNIIYAFNILGATKGLNNNQFSIESIKNDDFFEISNYTSVHIDKANIKIESLSDYINERKFKVKSISSISFITPYRLKREGNYVDNVNVFDVVNSINRRLTILNAMEGKKYEPYVPKNIPSIVSSSISWSDIQRYSNRQKTKMKLGGIIGKISFEQIDDIQFIEMLLAGEIMHIGKNVSFGYGKYEIK